mmetsp:Transcript_13208/g.44142  ORF Transcript_13208/g.44142 Transcript_13208/m.44142 type:complete len:269 (-) Transcript_13208:349-1155(-)
MASSRLRRTSSVSPAVCTARFESASPRESASICSSSAARNSGDPEETSIAATFSRLAASSRTPTSASASVTMAARTHQTDSQSWVVMCIAASDCATAARAGMEPPKLRCCSLTLPLFGGMDRCWCSAPLSRPAKRLLGRLSTSMWNEWKLDSPPPWRTTRDFSSRYVSSSPPARCSEALRPSPSWLSSSLMKRPKRDEFGLRCVEALPKPSSTGEMATTRAAKSSLLPATPTRRVRYAMTILEVSVLPDPDSPLTTMDWSKLRPVARR